VGVQSIVMSMSVCGYLRNHMSIKFTKSFVHVAHGHGSVLLRRHHNVLMDNITLSYDKRCDTLEDSVQFVHGSATLLHGTGCILFEATVDTMNK